MNLKKTIYLSLFVLMLLPLEAFSQLDNSGLFYRIREFTEWKPGDLDLNIYGLAFNKNNEYLERTATGYTFFGYLFRPELAYYWHENFSVKMGFIARKDFGNDDYQLFQPTFLLRYDYKQFKFLFGTIEGPLEHNYIEPIYDFERVITDNPENGLQVIYESGFLRSDAWISWNRMIYDRSPFREEFNGGVNLDLKFKDDEGLYFAIPLQSIATHVGGQIDDDPNPARTVTNFAAGLDIRKQFGEAGFFRGLELKSYVTNYYSLESESLIPPFRDGIGYYANLHIMTHLGNVMVSYWNGNEYSSWNGGHLYQSTSKNWREPLALQEEREVIIVRFLNDIEIKKDLRILPRFEPYWNLRDGQFGFSLGLYVKFQDYFHLTNVKANQN